MGSRLAEIAAFVATPYGYRLIAVAHPRHGFAAGEWDRLAVCHDHLSIDQRAVSEGVADRPMELPGF